MSGGMAFERIAALTVETGNWSLLSCILAMQPVNDRVTIGIARIAVAGRQIDVVAHFAFIAALS